MSGWLRNARSPRYERKGVRSVRSMIVELMLCIVGAVASVTVAVEAVVAGVAALVGGVLAVVVVVVEAEVGGVFVVLIIGIASSESCIHSISSSGSIGGSSSLGARGVDVASVASVVAFDLGDRVCALHSYY